MLTPNKQQKTPSHVFSQLRIEPVTRTRILTGLVSLPVIIVTIQVGGWWYTTVVTLIALIATSEFIHIMTVKGHRPHLILALAIVLVAMIDRVWPNWPVFIPAFVFLAMLGLVWELYRQNSEAPVVDWALTLTGGAYIGLGMAHLIGLRLLPDGHVWVWLAVLVTWGSDSFAYFGGRAFGKRQFWPRWSPKKTWAGIIAGYFGGMFGGLLVVLIFHFPLWHALILGLLAGFVGPFGDLSVSMMKRYAGVKDSSHLLPGHGGMLDRIDSVLFVIVVVYYYGFWVVL
jgi:phosphatidate cytidylyltransferase